MFGGLGLTKRLNSLSRHVPHVHRMLEIQSKYHYTNGKFLLSHGNVSTPPLQDCLRIRCGPWLCMHLASGLKSTLWRQQQLKPPSSILDTHRLPRQIVSDNGPQFVATSFQKFCESRGIKHIKTAPYSPRSNGEAERLVQTFKKAIEKRDPHTNEEIQEAAVDHDFQAMYRSTPQSTTNQTPSEILNNQRMRTMLDLINTSM